MKAKINQQPKMAAYLELNKKFGYGYQARIVMEMGGHTIDSVIDDNPLPLDEAYAGAVFAIDEINKLQGYNYEPRKVIQITQDAIQANRKRDFMSAKAARDIDTGKYEFVTQEAEGLL